MKQNQNNTRNSGKTTPGHGKMANPCNKIINGHGRITHGRGKMAAGHGKITNGEKVRANAYTNAEYKGLKIELVFIKPSLIIKI